jgi:hypothetical protein
MSAAAPNALPLAKMERIVPWTEDVLRIMDYLGLEVKQGKPVCEITKGGGWDTWNSERGEI